MHTRVPCALSIICNRPLLFLLLLLLLLLHLLILRLLL